jgi:hypothetical protein
MNTMTLTVRLPEEEYARLKTVAHDRDKSINKVVREAILADLNAPAPGDRKWHFPVMNVASPVGVSDNWDDRLEGFGQW